MNPDVANMSMSSGRPVETEGGLAKLPNEKRAVEHEAGHANPLRVTCADLTLRYRDLDRGTHADSDA